MDIMRCMCYEQLPQHCLSLSSSLSSAAVRKKLDPLIAQCPVRGRGSGS